MKKALITIVILSFIITGCGSNKEYGEDYKPGAIEITWVELSEGEVDGGEKVTFGGEVTEINDNGDTLTVNDNDGLYYVKNIDEADINLEDKVSIWGIYVGDEKSTRLPMIDAKIIEKK